MVKSKDSIKEKVRSLIRRLLRLRIRELKIIEKMEKRK